MLHLAVRWNKPEIVDRLIQLGININLQDKKFARTALNQALKLNFYDIANKLIDQDAKLSLSDKEGNTPLHELAWVKQNSTAAEKVAEIDLAKKIIEKELSLLARKNNLGNLPFHYAVTRAGIDFVNQVIPTAKDQINSTNKDGLSASHLLAENKSTSSDIEAIFALLVTNGADINATSSKIANTNPLDRAILLENKTLERLLGEKSVKPSTDLYGAYNDISGANLSPSR